MTVDANPAQLYLNLLKKTLSFLLWDEPGIPIETFNDDRTPLKRTIVSTVSQLLGKANLQLVRRRTVSQPEREEGLVHPMLADTMIGLRRLENIESCVKDVIQNNIPGDLIETGVWRGGACIFMRGILAAYGITDRRVFVADSFMGLPDADPENFPGDPANKTYIGDFLAVSKEQVEQNFRKYGLLDQQVVFLEGWFKDTLPTAPVEKLAIMRLDGDMYQSTIEALTYLYPKLSVGGYCIIDDYYTLNAARSAVNDYRAAQKIDSPIQQIDKMSVFWKKTEA